MEFAIEVAVPADAGALAQLHYLSHTTSFAAFASPGWVASRRLKDYERQWRDFFISGNPRSRAWVALSGSEVVGMVRVNHESEAAAQLTSMHVNPACQGRGIGSTLMKTAMDFMTDGGYRTATLGVIQANQPARRLYERAGWQVAELRDNGIEGVPIAVYSFDLR